MWGLLVMLGNLYEVMYMLVGDDGVLIGSVVCKCICIDIVLFGFGECFLWVGYLGLS